MPIPELQGKTGNGIRKLAQGRRTATEAWIEVWTGNVTDEYYNQVHGTSISNGHTLISANKANYSITVEAPGVPVVSERSQTISGINFTNDPVVFDNGGSFNNDPIEWFGLGIRKFKFTQLEDRWYDAYVSTTLVSAHGNGACKYAHIRFRPKDENRVRIVNLGCADDYVGLYGDEDEGRWPYEATKEIIKRGVDYVVSGDDFTYASNRARADNFWALPRNSNSSINPIDTGGAYESVAVTETMASMIANVVNVGDASTDTEHFMVWENLSAAMNPMYVILGYHGVVMPSDLGDHGVRFANGSMFGIWCSTAGGGGFLDALRVDYGLVETNADSRPADNSTTCWIHDGSDGTASDPYDQAIANPLLHQNILADMADYESYRTFCMTILDLLWYNRWEHNHVSATPTTMVVPVYLTNMIGGNNPTLSVAMGGMNVPDEYFYYPRWKYMDFGTKLRLYSTDQSFWNYTSHQLENSPKRTIDTDVADRDGVPQSVIDSLETVMTTTQISDLQTHMEASDDLFDCYAIISGDVTYPVGKTKADGTGGIVGWTDDVAYIETTGQGDGYSEKALSEYTSFKAMIEALACPVWLLTSDHHINMVTNHHANVVELHGSIGPSGGTRTNIGIPPAHSYNHQSVNTTGYNYLYVSEAEKRGVVSPADRSSIATYGDGISSTFEVENGAFSFINDGSDFIRSAQSINADGQQFATVRRR